MFWEYANLVDLSYKVVISQTLPVSELLLSRELETTGIEEPGRLQSMESQRIGLSDYTHTHTHTHTHTAASYRRKLEVKIGQLRNNNLQFCNSFLFSDELTSSGLTLLIFKCSCFLEHI